MNPSAIVTHASHSSALQRAFEVRASRPMNAFTLIELLVVVSIIALLIGILLPALGAAKEMSKTAVSMNNLKQLGIGLTNYVANNNGYFPKHSSLNNPSDWVGLPGRTRWADYLFPYMRSTAVYLSPLLTTQELTDFNKVFAHTVGSGNETKYGGYGINFQYLGNARFTPPFHGRLGVDVTRDAQTVAIGDTAGSRKGNMSNRPGQDGNAVYVLDPPLGSTRGASPSGGSYYEGGSDQLTGTPETYTHRSFAAQRSSDKANLLFADGHVDGMTIDEVDDFDKNGVKDNGYWNGRADPARK